MLYQLSYTGVLLRALTGIRTPDLLIRSQVLYPLSYKGVYCVTPAGFEPALPV